MNFDNILKNIRRYATLTPEEEETLCALLTIKKVKRKEFILREGDICTHVYYINKGCLRTYFVDKKGLEHNLYFAIEDWWVTDLYSRTRLAPTYCNIVALEDCELVEVNHEALEKFMEKAPALERFFRLCYEQTLVNQHLKNLDMLYMNSEERYISFRERNPKLADRIPQKHIATYLGLTPQFFNLIHAKVTRARN